MLPGDVAARLRAMSASAQGESPMPAGIAMTADAISARLREMAEVSDLCEQLLSARRRWSSDTRAALEAAGWFEGRNVAAQVGRWRDILRASDGWEMSSPAEQALTELGGLRVESSGPGLRCARCSFRLDPTLAEGERDRFDRLEPRAGEPLYPLGDVEGGHGFLAIGPSARVYIVMDFVLVKAASIDRALDSLVLGLPGRELE